MQSDRAVYAVAKELLTRLRAERRIAARLIGVGLSGLVRVGAVDQLTLFEVEGAVSLETERDRILARVLDEIRERFGEKALRRGAMGLG